MQKQYFDIQEIQNRRFMYNTDTCTFILGRQYGKSNKVESSHAEEHSISGATEPYDHFIRGWVGTSDYYKHGIIHFAPPVDSSNDEMYIDAYNTLQMFRENGATADTEVRGFGDVWEQSLSNILPGFTEQHKEKGADELSKKANAMDETFNPVLLLNKPAMFTNARIDRDTVPAGLFAYDIRHSDNGRAVAVEKNVTVNHMGTVITSADLDFEKKDYISLTARNGGLNFACEHDCITISEYIKHINGEKEAAKYYGVWAVRSAASIAGHSEAWNKMDGIPYVYTSKEAAQQKADESNEKIVSPNIHYSAKEMEPEIAANALKEWKKPTEKPYIKVFIQTKEARDKYSDVGEWLALPANAGELSGLLGRLGANGEQEPAFAVYKVESSIGSVCYALNLNENLDELNMLAHYLDDMEPFELDNLQAILQSGEFNYGCGGAALINLMYEDNFKSFNVIDAGSAEELGRYWKKEAPDAIPEGMTLEKYGKECIADEKRAFTPWGYVYKKMDLAQLYNGVVPDEYRITDAALQSLFGGEPIMPPDSPAIKNLAYVQENGTAFDTVKFYADADGGKLKIFYYNPDSDVGGQLVENHISLDTLADAFAECKTEEDFWNRLDERARQYLIDIDTPEFDVEAKAFVESRCDFCGETRQTMEQIRGWCQASHPQRFGNGAKNMEKPEVYIHPAAYAREHGELDRYRASNRLNQECARAIEDTIRENWSNSHLTPDAAKDVIEKYGPKRVNIVLAYTVSAMENDTRFSRDNRDWASGIPSLPNPCGGIVNSHPVKMDAFINQARAETMLDAAIPKNVHGYEIKRTIMFENDRGFAFGQKSTGPSPFVTWQVTEENGVREYYWGHFFANESAAVFDYNNRISQYKIDYPTIEEKRPSAVAKLEAAKQNVKPSAPGSGGKKKDLEME